MPDSRAALDAAIESAHERRTTHARFIHNPDEMMSRNSVCKIHGVTH
jgi:hypothetical protein